MPRLDDLDDLDLSTVELEDGTPLLASWSQGSDGAGVWVVRESLPASAITVELDPMRSLLVPGGFHPPSSTLQEAVTALYRDGYNVYRRVTDDDPDNAMQSRLCLLTDYRRQLPWDQVGGNGAVFGLSYGWPGQPAGGNVNVTTIGVEVRASEDPANEIGGCIASLQLGKDGDPPPTGSLWGASYTLRGPVERQPGGLMAYTAVVQNYYDGSGSRSDNYGYAAVTRPGIGDGADFHTDDPIRRATTFPVDVGFVVCGDSGEWPAGGGVGYRVGFQAGGAVSPWAERHEWRSRIGTGVLVQDWMDAGIHVRPPHPEATASPQLRLDRRDGQEGSYLECRSQDGLGMLAAILADGRIRAAGAENGTEVIVKDQLDLAVDALRAELRAEIRAEVDAASVHAVRRAPVGVLGRELARRASPLQPRLWRSIRRRARSAVGSG